MATELVKNREVERIYMEQLRNIETSVYILDKKEKQTKSIINQLRKPIAKPKNPYEPHLSTYIKDSLFWFLPLIIVIILYKVLDFLISFINFLDYLLSSLLDIIFYICCGIGGVIAVFGVFMLISGYVEYKKEQKKYRVTLEKNKSINTQNINKMKTNLARANQLMPMQNKIHKEYIEAVKIRESLYSINWIPNQYRNIRVVYYICDMVLSSNISIEEALKYYLLQEANNKLDEVLHKMDTIIENQNEIIINQAIISAQNQNLIQQNSTIIRQTAEIEQNTRLSAEYSRVGAVYAEANAYFSLATYLNNS